MKTTDLIPIILYQLKDGDRYGYEIIKQIEDCSNGKIVIKQPTLYSVLKKLEQNKFITSYWQDSEIGGKRHYYKLTNNGLSQLSTYPALQQLIADALDDEALTFTSTNSEPISYVSSNSTDGMIYNSPTTSINSDPIENVVTPIKIDLASPTGLIDNDVDIQFHLPAQDDTASLNTTSIFDAIEPAEDIQTSSSFNIFDMMEPATDIETSYSDINIFEAINNDNTDNLEQVAIQEDDLTVENDAQYDTTSTQAQIDNISNDDVVSIVTEVETVELKSKLADKVDTSIDSFIDTEINNAEQVSDNDDQSNIEQIKYLNYVDLSTDEKSCTRRKVISKHIQKMMLTCSTILLMFILTLVACFKYSFGKIYYIGAIISVLAIILYPMILLKDVSKLRFKYCTNPFKYSLFQDIFIKLSTFMSLLIATFAYNISTTSSIHDIFKLTNFANFYAPIMFASIFVFDLLYGIMLYKNYRTRK